MSDSNIQLPPEIDFSSFDFTNLANSFLSDEIQPKSSGEKYLVFFLDEELYAVATRQVAEVSPPLAVTPLPNAPEWLLGVANLRNEIIPVVSLPTLLEKQHSAISPRSKIVVLHSPESAPHVAFAADRLSEIISLRSDEIKADANEKSPRIAGQATHLAKRLNVIDTEKIIASLVV